MAFTADIPTIDIIEVSDYVIRIESIGMLHTRAVTHATDNIRSCFERSLKIIRRTTQAP